MFGGESVIDANNAKPCAMAYFGADVIMAVQPAKHRATAMQIYDRWLRTNVEPAGDASNVFIASGHTRRITTVKTTGHGVIDVALVSNGATGGVGWVACIGAGNESPSRLVNKSLVICGWHSIRTMMMCQASVRRFGRPRNCHRLQ